MNTKKVIVYGCGSRFARYRKKIEEMFQIIYVTGKDEPEQDLGIEYIKPVNICEKYFDYIVVASVFDVEIVNLLVDKFNISSDKILVDYVLFDNKLTFYGQTYEDLKLLFILKLLNINIKDINYLELGTNHPMRHNNTYFLYREGARGTLVEPNRELKNIIQCVRKDDTLITDAIDVEGTKNTTFYIRRASTLSTTLLDNDEKNKDSNLDIIGQYDVKTKSINDVVRELDTVPFLLSIDIEGKDYEILCDLDMSKYSPSIIIVELVVYGQTESCGNKILEFLEKNDYVVLPFENELNAICIKKFLFNQIEHKLFNL